MPVIPKQKSALWALAAAGGLWAWQNRDKLRGYLEQNGVLSQPGTSHQRTLVEDAPATGETRRISDMNPAGEYTNESTTKYDPSI